MSLPSHARRKRTVRLYIIRFILSTCLECSKENGHTLTRGQNKANYMWGNVTPNVVVFGCFFLFFLIY